MTKETNQIDFIEFPAKSVTEITMAKRFYGEVFDWSFTNWGEDYIDTTNSGVGSGFNADEEHRPNSPLVVVYAHDLKTAFAKVLAAGGQVTRDIFSFPGGRRFHFKDPIGNELAVWSDQ
jgi:uncharacterized protein